MKIYSFLILKSLLVGLVFSQGSFGDDSGATVTPVHVSNRAEFERALAQAELEQGGYKVWTWANRDSLPAHDFVIWATRPELTRPKVDEFIRVLTSQRTELQALYQDIAPVTDAEYLLLARMAIGFLGAESEFFASTRYFVKESCIFCFAAAKYAASVVGLADYDQMSRGPIQMKEVPELISATYGIEARDLNKPANSARAIMGYLIEALTQLKRTAANNGYTFVTPETYADYLPYIYFGSARRLRDGTATPDQNIYIQRMRVYMDWVIIYVKD